MLLRKQNYVLCLSAKEIVEFLQLNFGLAWDFLNKHSDDVETKRKSVLKKDVICQFVLVLRESLIFFVLQMETQAFLDLAKLFEHFLCLEHKLCLVL